MNKYFKTIYFPLFIIRIPRQIITKATTQNSKPPKRKFSIKSMVPYTMPKARIPTMVTKKNIFIFLKLKMLFCGGEGFE